MKLKDTCSLEEKLDKPRQHTKKQRHHFADKGPYSPSYGFSSSHVQMWELDIKKAERQRTDALKLVLEKTPASPLDCKDIKPVNPKENHPWIFTGRTDAEAEASILWPPYAKSQLTGKDPDSGNDWGQEGKGTTEDAMVGWHHWLNGHEFESTLRDSKGWGCKESDKTEQLNNKNLWQWYTIWYQTCPSAVNNQKIGQNVWNNSFQILDTGGIGSLRKGKQNKMR